MNRFFFSSRLKDQLYEIEWGQWMQLLPRKFNWIKSKWWKWFGSSVHIAYIQYLISQSIRLKFETKKNDDLRIHLFSPNQNCTQMSSYKLKINEIHSRNQTIRHMLWIAVLFCWVQKVRYSFIWNCDFGTTNKK